MLPAVGDDPHYAETTVEQCNLLGRVSCSRRRVALCMQNLKWSDWETRPETAIGEAAVRFSQPLSTLKPTCAHVWFVVVKLALMQVPPSTSASLVNSHSIRCSISAIHRPGGYSGLFTATVNRDPVLEEHGISCKSGSLWRKRRQILKFLESRQRLYLADALS
jgi:hypothetical protein